MSGQPSNRETNKLPGGDHRQQGIYEDVSPHERTGLRADDSVPVSEDSDTDVTGAIQEQDRQNVWG
ncbi:hypothetical protein [Paenibacillus lutrae]|uniref:Uncharacterized protein n=1 Tax=Paenibacillus lutrae TaxID=2078573 RepID=A0A7X3FGV2_9BACL|nr:hypothetical protein [Paenibacillus lutrae]MVO99509.1 hypothetical protein [Paenibacillus lutrae]